MSFGIPTVNRKEFFFYYFFIIQIEFLLFFYYSNRLADYRNLVKLTSSILNNIWGVGMPAKGLWLGGVSSRVYG